MNLHGVAFPRFSKGFVRNPLILLENMLLLEQPMIGKTIVTQTIIIMMKYHVS